MRRCVVWIVLALLGAPSAWAEVPAPPVAPVPPDHLFLSAAGPETIAYGGLYVRDGEVGGRHRYRHVIEGMGGQIWFGQPARVPGQLVFDHDESGPRTDDRWLIGSSPEDTAFQAFATSDSPVPPASGWDALFSAYLPEVVLTFPPSPTPLAMVPVGMGTIGLMVPATFRGTVRDSMRPRMATFTDSVDGSQWWIERRERGVGPGDPRHTTLLRRLKRDREVKGLRAITLEEPGGVPSGVGGRAQLPRRIVLYRQGELDHCRFYSFGTSASIVTRGEETTRAQRVRTLEAICRSHSVGLPRSQAPTPKAIKRMMAHLPGAEGLEMSREDLGLLSLYDKGPKVHLELLQWSIKSGPPYGDAITRSTARKRLLEQGCTPRKLKAYRLSGRRGWRARCEVKSNYAMHETSHVLTYVFPGETVWLLSLWGEERDWAKLEALGEGYLAGGQLN